MRESYSIFIRLLEYYDGILFLIANRVRIFDKAFQSFRIQVVLEYENLIMDQCKQIWYIWLDKAEHEVKSEQIKRYLNRYPNALKLNGLQIRKAFKSDTLALRHTCNKRIGKQRKRDSVGKRRS